MPQRYLLEKPNVSSFEEKDFLNLEFIADSDENFGKILLATSYPLYLYWDKVKYKKFTSKEPIEKIWAAIKFFRNFQSSPTEIKAENGESFRWVHQLPGLEEFLHKIDLNTGGHLASQGVGIDEKSKMKFISRGIVEEAIASAQLEGASITRKLAKKFLAEGRAARTSSEHMILNNYQSMRAVEEDLKKKPLTLDLLFELHAMIVKNTVSKNELHRFRKDSDNIIVGDALGKFAYHVPPKISFVEKEIERFLNFANDSLGQRFLHPVIKAVMLHFWVAYLHPFTDGNGRLARLVFYWYLLKKGYWAFSYLPISTMIRKSPSQYLKSYVYSEQDDFDLTYFIDYNVRKIKLAMKDFEKYMKKASLKNSRVNLKAKTIYNFNERQIQLIQYYYEHKDEYTSPAIHMNQYQISKSTAIRDLQDLLEKGFVSLTKNRKRSCYFSTDKIKELFKE